jgi:hypothetical protein
MMNGNIPAVKYYNFVVHYKLFAIPKTPKPQRFEIYLFLTIYNIWLLSIAWGLGTATDCFPAGNPGLIGKDLLICEEALTSSISILNFLVPF